MIYLKDGNVPLNLAFDDEIVQEANGTYVLSFKFPVSDNKWQRLTKETFLLADDLHGEQEFFVFDVVKKDGYIEVFAKQVVSLLHYYAMSSVSVDRGTGQTVMSALAASVKRPHPFSFFSDITERHTLNKSNTSVMTVLAKDKHSIIGQWGGDLVRDKYQVKLLKNGGSESEALFMYKKNIRSYNEPSSVAKLRTRIHFRRVIKDEETKEEQIFAVTVDSPLINSYSQIYEDTMEVSDEDVKDLASLTAYGKSYFSRTLCDIVESSIEISVENSLDVPIRLFDVVSVFYEPYGVDLRQKITKYVFSPMSKKLKSVGFGKFGQSLGNTVSGMVNDAVAEASNRLSDDFEARLQKEIDNANKHFEAEFEKGKQAIDDGIEVAKAKAESVKDEITSKIDADIRPLADEAKRVADSAVSDLERQRQALESARTELGALWTSVSTAKTEAVSEAVAEAGQIVKLAKTDITKTVEVAKQEAINEVTSRLDEARSTLNSSIQTAKREAVTSANLKISEARAELEKQVKDTEAYFLLFNGSPNLLSLSGSTKGAFKNTGGGTTKHALYSYAKPIKVAAGENYTLQTWVDSINNSSWAGYIFLDDNLNYVQGTYASGYFGKSEYNKRSVIAPENAKYIQFSYSNDVFGDNPNFRIQFEKGLSPSEYHKSYYDIQEEQAVYKQENDRKIAELTKLSRDVNDGFKEHKAIQEQTANGFRQQIRDLETFQHDEEGRKARILSLVREETAGQLDVVRSQIATDYVTKNQLSETSTEITQQFERLKIGNKNLFALSTCQTGAYRNTGGQLTKDARYGYSDLISVEADSDYILQAWVESSNPISWVGLIALDENESFISGSYRSFYLRDVTSVLRKLRFPATTKYVQFSFSNDVFGDTPNLRIQFEKGTIPTDYRKSEVDKEAEQAMYKQTVEQAFSELQKTIKESDGAFQEYKTSQEQTINGFKQSITALESFKNGESDRQERYLNLSRNETVDQLKVMRSQLSDDFISTNQLIETTRGIERQFEAIRIGSKNLLSLFDSTKGFYKNTSGVNVSGRYAYSKLILIEVGKNYILQSWSDTTNDFSWINYMFLDEQERMIDGSYRSYYQGNERYRKRDIVPPENAKFIQFSFSNDVFGDNPNFRIQFEKGTIPTDYRPAEEEFRNEFFTYKQGVDGQLSELTRQVGTTDGAFATFKSTYERTAESVRQQLSALETYKNDESQRSQAYFEASKRETARQLELERKAISEGYVSRRTYQEDVEKSVERFERIIEGKGFVTDNAVNTKLSSYVTKTALSSEFQKTAESFSGEIRRITTRLDDETVLKTEFNSFKDTVNEHKRIIGNGEGISKAIQTATKFVQEISEGGSLYSVVKSAEGLSEKITSLESYKNSEAERSQAYFNASKEETARQLREERQTVTDTYVAKSSYERDALGLTQRFQRLEAGLNGKVSSSDFQVTTERIEQSVRTLDGEVMKSNSFRIDETGLVLKAGKTFNGRTMTTMITQDAENISLIASQLRVSADMIVNGSITTNHILAKSIETGHLKTGSVTTAILSANAVTADKLKVDQALIDKLFVGDLMAKTMTAQKAFITALEAVQVSASSLTSGVITAKNGAMKIDLDDAEISFDKDASIIFKSANNALYRQKNTHTAFVHFEDAGDVNDSIYAAIGVTSSGDGVNSKSSGRFAGARFFRSARGRAHDGGEDYVEIFGDTIYFKDAFNQQRGFVMRPTALGGMLDLNQLYHAVLALKRIWIHARNTGYNLGHHTFGSALEREFANMGL